MRMRHEPHTTMRPHLSPTWFALQPLLNVRASDVYSHVTCWYVKQFMTHHMRRMLIDSVTYWYVGEFVTHWYVEQFMTHHIRRMLIDSVTYWYVGKFVTHRHVEQFMHVCSCICATVGDSFICGQRWLTVWLIDTWESSWLIDMWNSS